MIEDSKILHKDELKPFLIDDISSLNNFLKDNFYSIIVFVENIEDLYKKSDNIIEDINILFDNNDNSNIKISTIPFEKINEIIDLSLSEDDPKVIEIEKLEITNIVSLFDFEKLVSLYELSKFIIHDTSKLEDIFQNDKNSLLLLSDDLEELSELLPEPRKNINQLYDHFFKVDTKGLELNILYSSAEDLNSFLYTNDIEELPLPLVFKVDYTGTLSFPIRIKRVDKSPKDYEDVDYAEVIEKYNAIIEEMKLK